MDAEKVNALYPKIGKLGGRPVLRWDPATQCSERCPIACDCTYKKQGKCSIEVLYMNTVFNNLVHPDLKKGIADRLNDIELQRVGLHLVPLYHQLIKMKKEAYAVKTLSHVNKQGSIKIHPVFGEIREIIRCIAKEVKDLGINQKWEEKFGKAGVMDLGSGVGIEELMSQGDPGFYESISHG